MLGLSSSDKYLQLDSSSKPSKKDKKSRRKKKKHQQDESDDDIQPAHEVSTVVDMPEVRNSSRKNLIDSSFFATDTSTMGQTCTECYADRQNISFVRKFENSLKKTYLVLLSSFKLTFCPCHFNNKRNPYCIVSYQRAG